MSGRHNKRLSGTRGADRRTFSLMVHGAEFGAGEEVVVNPDCFPDIKVNDLVEISQPGRDHHRLILQIMSLSAVRGKLQISILKDVAAQFGLDTFHHVVVQKVDTRDVTVDYMELTFRDQFVSRADIWRVKVAMFGKCVYIGKNVETLGVRSQVEALLSSNQNVMCGVVGADTKMIVRSRSSRLIWLVQMSTEMWEFAPDGELYYEKMLNRLLKVLVSKWSDCSVSHSVTIIAFSRSYYDKNQFPDDYDPTSAPFRDPLRQGFGPGCPFADTAHGYGPAVHVDQETGSYYEDFYKVVVMNYTGPDWGHLLKILKEEFAQYHEKHRWRTAEEFLPAEYELCRVGVRQEQASAYAQDCVGAVDDVNIDEGTFVKWKSLPHGVPSRAVNGNVLEAINVTLNILDKHFMDRDLNRTGQSIVMLTAGSSVFRVDERLVEITKQRMMDNGVGMDMVSLATPPLHAVPLFICRPDKSTKMYSLAARTSFRNAMIRSPSTGLVQSPHDDPVQVTGSTTTAGDEGSQKRAFYIVPHWVNITFLEFDCQCAALGLTSSNNSSRQTSKKVMSHRTPMCECQARRNKTFMPLPPFRMFDMTAATGKLTFPVALSNIMKSRKPQVEDDDEQNNVPVGSRLEATRQDSPRRRLSNLSDTLSTASPNESTDQWNLCKSPDFVVHRSPRLDSYAAVGFSSSMMVREALEEYDAQVFTPAAWKQTSCCGETSYDGFSPSPFDEETDVVSLSLTGDMLSLINAKTNSRWKSVSSHAAMGSSSLVHSILSPRNSMPQSRSSSSVNRQLSGTSPQVGPMRRDMSAQNLGSFMLSDATTETSPQLKVDPRKEVETAVYRSISHKKSPPLAPSGQPGRGLSAGAAEIVRSGIVKSQGSASQLLLPESRLNGSDVPPTESENAVPLSRSLNRSFRSPPLPASTLATLHPSLMELSGSYKKSFLTGNGMLPAMRRTESDQTSTTPIVGSYHQNGIDPTSTTTYQRNPHELNPFRYSSATLASTTARITSDRRRWSHLFPAMSNPSRVGSLVSGDDDKQIHRGPNWKSLTSPAILPLTTDYHPAPKDLYTSYTESFYTLTLPPTDGGLFPKYKNHDELLIEMICQRLASDFQLVAQEAGAEADVVRNRVLAGTTNRGPSGESRDTTSNTTTYYLSMGHRIHQIIYDAELQAIEVKRYIERASQGQHNEPVIYKYSLWVDRTQSFHPLQQNFYQYPMPEDNWNSLDHLLCGYHDEMTDMIKYRRIRFAVLPPAVVVTGSEAEKEAYALRFTKFVDYLQTRVASEHGAQEKIRIKVTLDPLPSPNLRQQVRALSYKMSCESMASYTRLKGEDPRNEWLMMHVEDTMQVDKSYHFDVRWLACSGIIVDDFISTIRRKAKQAGLELRRIPEYTSVSFLHLHPLIAPIFLPMPLEIMQNSEREKTFTKVLVSRLDFIFDDEKLADSRGIGYGLGIGKEEKISLDTASRIGMRSQRRVRSKEEIEIQLLEKWRKRGYKQYIHRQAPVFLRLIHNGVVWIPSYDYDQISTPQQVEGLFKEICGLIQASATLSDLVSSCCATEAA